VPDPAVDETPASDPDSLPAMDTPGPVPSDLHVSTMQRLAFIRYLYATAVEQSRQPGPVAALAVLTLHDAVELFLQLAAEHTNANPGKRPEFGDYFGVINKELAPRALFQQGAMTRLNNARVALKHYGNLSSRLVVEQLRGDVTRFFEDNVPLIFGLDYHSISLVDLIACDAARESLKTASDHLNAGDTAEAMEPIAIAFAQLVDDYEAKVEARYNRSPVLFGGSFNIEAGFMLGRHRDLHATRQQNDFEDTVLKIVTKLQDAIKPLALGLDYRRFARFHLLSPTVLRMFDGSYQTIVMQGMRGSITWPPTEAACQFCFDFVVDSAIRLQDFDIEGP
jgi:hypothetical protein